MEDTRSPLEALQMFMARGHNLDQEHLAALRTLDPVNHVVNRKQDNVLFESLTKGTATHWKVDVLLSLDKRFASSRHRQSGRLPLHVAVEYCQYLAGSEKILNLLIDAYPEAVQEPDPQTTDGRLPLHALLDVDMQSFPSAFVEIAKKMIDKHPEATYFRPPLPLPLHQCIERMLPAPLLSAILSANRSAAALPQRGSTKLPLHMALERGYNEATVFEDLREAHGAALLETMERGGEAMVPLEYAVRERSERRKTTEVLSCLLAFQAPQEKVTSLSDNPRVLMYALAAASKCTSILRDDEQEQDRDARPGVRQGMEMDSRHRLRFFVRLPSGELLRMEEEHDMKVEDLKHEIREKVRFERTISLTLGGRKLEDGFPLSHYPALSANRKDAVVSMSLGSGILQHAILEDVSEDITLTLLELHPSAAKEPDVSGALPLIAALSKRHSAQVISRLLDLHGAARNVQVPKGSRDEHQYPLHIALQRGYGTDIIRKLLAQSDQDDWCNGQFCPKSDERRRFDDERREVPLPLHLAIARHNSVDTVKVLLDAGCKASTRPETHDRVTERTTFGHSALDTVIVSGRSGESELFGLVLDRILEEDPRTVGQQTAVGQRPLHLCAAHGAPADIIDSLINKEQEKRRESALSWRPTSDFDQGRLHCPRGHVLVEQRQRAEVGSFRCADCKEDQEQASFACPQCAGGYRLCLECSKWQVEAEDTNGHLPLHIAVMKQAKFSVVKCLVKHSKLAVNYEDAAGRTPLQLAVMHRASPGVVLILARMVNEIADTARQKAMQRGVPESQLPMPGSHMLAACDRRGLSLVELAAVSDAPRHVIQELAQVTPPEIWSVNLLNGKLPPTQATSLILAEAARKPRCAADHESEVGSAALERGSVRDDFVGDVFGGLASALGWMWGGKELQRSPSAGSSLQGASRH